jgi:ElaB/YqjD/DUF883 family membrane-anchored ribosome-binding protein
MINLLNQKLEAVIRLKDYTKEIAGLSPKIEDERINSLINERLKYFDEINKLNNEISSKSKKDSCIETEEIKNIREKIKKIIQETIIFDNEIRKNINSEIKDVKDKLNQPNPNINSKLINIKI